MAGASPRVPHHPRILSPAVPELEAAGDSILRDLASRPVTQDNVCSGSEFRVSALIE
jgi:hypothetical protein